MPEYIEILSVEPSFDDLPVAVRGTIKEAARSYPEVTYPECGDDDHTQESLSEGVHALAGICPELSVLVVVRESDWAAFSCLRVGSGNVDWEPVDFSTNADHYQGTDAAPAPEVAVTVDVPADAFADLLDAACEESMWEYDEFTLRFEYNSAKSMLEVLRVVAGHLVESCEPFLAEADGAFYECTIDRETGVTARPLWPWLDDPQLRGHARDAIGVPAGAALHRAPTRLVDEPSVSEPTSPLTTGSLKARRAAAYAVAGEAREAQARRGRRAARGPLTSSEHWQQLADAIVAPENLQGRCEALRGDLYALLCEFDVPGQAAFVLEYLPQEPVSVRKRAYPGIAKLRIKGLDGLLARTFCTGEESEVHAIGRVIWRSDPAVEILVREHLVPASLDAPELERRILYLLNEECIQIPLAWIAGAAPELENKLGPLLRQAADTDAGQDLVEDLPVRSPESLRPAGANLGRRVGSLALARDQVRAALASYASDDSSSAATFGSPLDSSNLCALWCHSQAGDESSTGTEILARLGGVDPHVQTLFRGLVEGNERQVELASRLVFSFAADSSELYDVFAHPFDQEVSVSLDAPEFDFGTKHPAVHLLFGLRRVFAVIVGCVRSLLDQDESADEGEVALIDEINAAQQSLLDDLLEIRSQAPLLLSAERYLMSAQADTSLPALFARARHGLTVCTRALSACAVEHEKDASPMLSPESLEAELRSTLWAARLLDRDVDIATGDAEKGKVTKADLLGYMNKDVVEIRAFSTDTLPIDFAKMATQVADEFRQMGHAVNAGAEKKAFRALQNAVSKVVTLGDTPEWTAFALSVVDGLRHAADAMSDAFDIPADDLLTRAFEKRLA